MILEKILISIGIFFSSVCLYYFFYFLVWKIIFKEFPKGKKDLEINSLKIQLQTMEESNKTLKKENQEITNLILRRLNQ